MRNILLVLLAIAFGYYTLAACFVYGTIVSRTFAYSIDARGTLVEQQFINILVDLVIPGYLSAAYYRVFLNRRVTLSKLLLTLLTFPVTLAIWGVATILVLALSHLQFGQPEFTRAPYLFVAGILIAFLAVLPLYGIVRVWGPSSLPKPMQPRGAK